MHPTDPNSIMVGGFNGYLKIYDLRNMQNGPTGSHGIADGGLWRITGKAIDSDFYIAVATCSENAFLVLDSECR